MERLKDVFNELRQAIIYGNTYNDVYYFDDDKNFILDTEFVLDYDGFTIDMYFQRFNSKLKRNVHIHHTFTKKEFMTLNYEDYQKLIHFYIIKLNNESEES